MYENQETNFTAEKVLECLEGKSENLKKIPVFSDSFFTDMFERDVIYFLHQTNGEKASWDNLVYIGQTKSFMTRIVDHRKKGKKFNAVSYIYVDKNDKDFIEQFFITLLKPDLNIQHNSGNKNYDCSEPVSQGMFLAYYLGNEHYSIERYNKDLIQRGCDIIYDPLDTMAKAGYIVEQVAE